MDPNHYIGFVPTFSLIARHIAVRFGTLIIKILLVIIAVLLAILFSIGTAFSKLARQVRSASVKAQTSILTTHEGTLLESKEQIETVGHEKAKIEGESGLGGQNGVPDGWVRYEICRTVDISEFDLEQCDGCRQVLKTEIEMLSGNGDSIEELVERQKRIECWLEDIKKVDHDSGYSSPEAGGIVGRGIVWRSPDC